MTSAPEHLSHPKYRPDIDGMRAIAVLSVVVFHAFPTVLKGGFIGVDIFFVISGYLISTIIFENLERDTFSFGEFYARRVKRIFPALLLVLVASWAIGWMPLLSDEYEQLGRHIAAGAGFVSNFVLWSEAGYFDTTAELKPLLHLWSLGIEEQFYIVWPLLLWMTWKGRFNLLTITLLIAALSFYLNMAGIKKDAVATFYSPQTRFWELLCGSLLAWTSLHRTETTRRFASRLDGWISLVVYREKRTFDGTTLADVASLIGAFLIVLGTLRIDKNMSFPGEWALLPVFGAVFLIAAGPGALFNRRILSNRILVWFGLISFPLYLWHWPLLSFVRILESETPGPAIRTAAVALAILLAWLTYRFVERPLRLGPHGKAKVAVLVGLMVGVGAVGALTDWRDGFDFRRPPNLLWESLGAKLKKNGDICVVAPTKGYPGLSSCDFGATGSTNVMFLYGDSHSQAISEELGKELIKRNIRGIKISLDDCSAIPTIRDTRNQDMPTEPCVEKFQTLLQYIRSSKGDVTVSIRWPFRLYPVPGEIMDMPTRNSEGGVEKVSYREYVALVGGHASFGAKEKKEALELLLNGFASTGQKVYLIYSVPEVSWDIARLNYNHYNSRHRPLSEISIPHDDFKKRNTWLNSVFDGVLDHENIVPVRPETIFCNSFAKGRCVAQYDAIPFYYDDNHLSDAGARLVIDEMFRPRPK